MTDFERNARYSYEEKLEYLKSKGHDSLHLQTMSYNGYDVIMVSGLQHGVKYLFYKDKHLVKMRHWNWKDDIRLYAQRYIDQELNARQEEKI
jgi:hypothetical protein